MGAIVRVRDAEKDIDKIKLGAEIIKSGGLVIFPTETVYGIGCDALNEKAVEKLYRVKGRPANKPLILHVCSTDQVYELVEVNREAKILIEEFFPGPLAIVLKKKEKVPDITSGMSDKIAVRMPANRIALKLIELSETPLGAPSANKSGSISPTRAEDAVEEFRNEMDEIGLVIDGGETDIGIESTVIDLTVRPARILRLGRIGVEELGEFLDVVTEKPKSEHYRMKAKVKIVDPAAIPEIVGIELRKGKSVGVCAFEDVIDKALEYMDSLDISDISANLSDSRNVQRIRIVRVSDLEDYSRKLFRSMRELANCDVAVFQSVRETGIGRAIMMRLREAVKQTESAERTGNKKV